MLRFTIFAFSAWASQATAAHESLRSIAQTSSRTLTEELIAGYAPVTKVTDHNAIDQDQKYLEVNLAKRTSTGFANAKAIYEEGGNSKSYAAITLDVDITTDISKGTAVTGTNDDGDEIRGKVYKTARRDQRQVKIQYDTSSNQETWVMCRVGALKENEGLVTTGCLKDSGSVSIGNDDFSYSYDHTIHNNNGRTLQGFSTSVQSKMIDCSPGCPFTDAEMFVNYYGRNDYGDHWITSAFNKDSTDFTNRGNADFSIYGESEDALVEVIKKGTVYLNVFMYVIREFEDAIVDCKTQCTSANCNDDPVEAWDEGVAFYTGSLEGRDGTSTGHLLHQLADKRCQNFKTCGTNGGLVGNTRSYVNHKLLRLFEMGKSQVMNKECGAAKLTVRSITKHMYIPLIQGTLRYAYVLDRDSSHGNKEAAEGAVFAASVLPRIHSANATSAQTIYDNMKVGATSTSFLAVKRAFESVYPGLGISCAKIGGVVNSVGDYKTDARPCADDDDSTDDDDKATTDDDDKKTADDDDKATADDDDKKTSDDDDKKTSDDDDGNGASAKNFIVVAFSTIFVMLFSM
mmetsp:Transcript_25728/g.30313  ORF Transcript_25728/g.30313 Transcript_25728/m.30313 type:complete len:572 (-) Transcript_25728:155-1870(-)